MANLVLPPIVGLIALIIGYGIFLIVSRDLEKRIIKRENELMSEPLPELSEQEKEERNKLIKELDKHFEKEEKKSRKLMILLFIISLVLIPAGLAFYLLNILETLTIFSYTIDFRSTIYNIGWFCLFYAAVEYFMLKNEMFN